MKHPCLKESLQKEYSVVWNKSCCKSIFVVRDTFASWHTCTRKKGHKGNHHDHTLTGFCFWQWSEKEQKEFEARQHKAFEVKQ